MLGPFFAALAAVGVLILIGMWIAPRVDGWLGLTFPPEDQHGGAAFYEPEQLKLADELGIGPPPVPSLSWAFDPPVTLRDGDAIETSCPLTIHADGQLEALPGSARVVTREQLENARFDVAGEVARQNAKAMVEERRGRMPVEIEPGKVLKVGDPIETFLGPGIVVDAKPDDQQRVLIDLYPERRHLPADTVVEDLKNFKDDRPEDFVNPLPYRTWPEALKNVLTETDSVNIGLHTTPPPEFGTDHNWKDAGTVQHSRLKLGPGMEHSAAAIDAVDMLNTILAHDDYDSLMAVFRRRFPGSPPAKGTAGHLLYWTMRGRLNELGGGFGPRTLGG